MEKYINVKNLADYLNEECKNYLEDDSIQCTIAAGVVCSIKEDILKFPTADVVEVVRCKDCVYNKGQLPEPNTNIIRCHKELPKHRNLNDYCSYGERKENNNA